MISPGKRFREALKNEKPLQIVGTLNPLSALLAEKAGFLALYLSGAGVANASLGLPDLGATNLNDVLEDARRITGQVALPLLVDVDTGWGTELNIARTVHAMIDAKVAAIHIEDQVFAKRCGHRPGKAVVSTSEMVDRLKAALDARTDPHFVIMARTDALALEGLEKTLERIQAYVETGADMIFFEGARDLSEYKTVAHHITVPVLANITEFGSTPLFTREQLAAAGIQMALYPLSAFRAMNQAALEVYQTIRQTGTQQSIVSKMQTRDALYEILNYHFFETQLDLVLSKGKNHG